ncbi:MAG: electron transport complex subunit RsxC [Luminiphilus sp.]|nr:electron transport complex subunit RsxC [Luminiphilus sp.]
MRVIHDIHGGIHPPERKTLSRPGVLHQVVIPPLLVLPLRQHLGAPAQPIVAVGDTVLGGEKLAEPQGVMSVPIHAPTSGVVRAIELRPIAHASGLEDLCVVLETDGKDRWVTGSGNEDWRKSDPAALLDVIREAGIAGLGGAGFPTAVKLNPGSSRTIETLLINGTECEPYITADDTLMQCYTEALIEGAQILAHIVDAPHILIGIEDNKPAAISRVTDAASKADPSIEVASFPTRYPSGGEKQIIEILTGRQVPSGGIPADIGMVCVNPGTAVAVREAIIKGKPLTHRIVTLTGEALAQPANVLACLGTPIHFLLENAGLTAGPRQRIIHGGPMMGFAVSDLDAPITKITNCLLAPTAEELPLPETAKPCIRCGHCAEACPASLLPQQLYWYARAKDQEQLMEHRLFDCIECGACAYVCPSQIPLVQYYRAAKGQLRDSEQERRRSDNSRDRFEARQTRLEAEIAAREAKRAARKAAAQNKASEDGSDPIQAAIERAKARKADQEQPS